VSRYAIVAVDMTPRQKAGLWLGRAAAGDAEEPYGDRLRRTFHYAVPDHLRGALRVGHLVWVPFGRERRHGLVVGLDERAPVPHVKAIHALIFPEPVVQPYQIQLADWMSREYLAPLWDTLLLFIPPGLLPGTERWVRRRQAATTGELTQDERRTLAWLDARGGAAPQRDVERLLGSARRARRVLAALRRRGLVEEELVERAPAVRPRRERFVQLAVPSPHLRNHLRRLGRPSPRADVAEWLDAARAAGTEWTTLDELCQATGVSPRVVRRLAQEGVVELVPARRTARLRGAPEALVATLSRAPKQRAVVEWLAAHPGPQPAEEVCRATGASPATLRTLAARGHILLSQEPARVRLLVSGDTLDRLLAAWRRLGVAWRVLNYLARNPTEVPLSEVAKLPGVTPAHVKRLAEAGLVRVEEREVYRTPLAGRVFAGGPPPELTPEQQRAWDEIRAAIRRARGEVFVLHGITGSGKTELYLRAVAETLALGKQAIVLVPEIALTPQTVARFGARFGGHVALQHSRLPPGTRFDEWRRLRNGLAHVAVGSRSALFSPVPRPGLIVIDEEHEWTYKQEGLPGLRLPHYHARDVAARLAQLTGAVVILGSATPSLEAYERARLGAYRLLRLRERVVTRTTPRDHFRLLARPPSDRVPSADERLGGGLPPVQIVDLRAELKAGNTSIFSRALQGAVERALALGHQALLFINRRGSHTFVMCRDCGWVPLCSRCDLPLTYHASTPRLSCHQCNERAPVPAVCARCMSPRVKHFGIGTEEVERAARERFPGARVLRWDRDTVARPEDHERLLHAFAAGEADILVGTQMIAKGLDLPLVTVVGVISADTTLHLPDFRAAERTFQLLTQVAGRAGRSALGGRVIVQTYTPHHYAILAAAEHDYERFFRAEMAFRREHAYPPVARLVKLSVAHPRAAEAERAARALAGQLRRRRRQLGLGDVDVLGPAPAFFARLRGRYRWHLFLRGAGARELLRHTPVPLGWDVDVDPLDVLT